MRLLAWLALITSSLLAACGSDSAAEPSSEWDRDSLEVNRGVPEGVDGTLESPAGAGIDGDDLLIVTYGSSSNPRVITELQVDGQSVVVIVAAKEGVAATMDYAPTTSRTRLPDAVSTDAPVTVVLADVGSVEINENPGFEWFPRPED